VTVLLAVDTSTTLGSIALFRDGVVLAEETWQLQRGHDAAVFAGIERLLTLTGLTVRDIGHVGVAVGPGSFTGVRIAIATAQGIARGSGARAVGVSTLDVIAHPWSTTRERVCAVLPAGRDEVCAAVYRDRAGSWSRTSELLVGTPAELARSLAAGALFAGEIDDAARDAIGHELGPRAAFAPRGTTRRAGDLAAIASERIAAGEAAAPETLEPVYVRLPAIKGPRGELVSAPALATSLPGSR
jgi:tRNA threonylcarbamoyladenosine biosynthesis protein TsaB